MNYLIETIHRLSGVWILAGIGMLFIIAFACVKRLENLLKRLIYERPIATEGGSIIKPTTFPRGESIISGYRANSEDAGKIISLMDEMQKFGAAVRLQYCPRNTIFTIRTDAEMEYTMFERISMFAKGFLKASSITTTKER